MDIDFFRLLDEDGWVPLSVEHEQPAYLWHDGGLLANAPADVAAAFDGAMWGSTKVDRSFNLVGLRCRPGFTIPMRHLDMDELIIVIGGEVVVEYRTADAEVERRAVGAGQFWVCEAGTPFTLTAGPHGVTYIASWPEPVAGLETHWHDRGGQ